MGSARTGAYWAETCPNPAGLFAVALAFEVVKQGIGVAWFRWVEVPDLYSSTTFSLQMYQFFQSLIFFAISPCLLLLALYLVARKLTLDETLWSASVSLFLGGAIGEILGFLLTGFGLPTITLSNFYSFLQIEFGNGWAIAELSLSALEDGISVAFVGIAAIILAAYRREHAVPRPGESSLAQNSQAM